MNTGILFEALEKPLVVLPKQSSRLNKLWVCIGPGSYVGIRHSIAFAQAVQLTAHKQGKTVDVIPFTVFDFVLSLGAFPWSTNGKPVPQITVVIKAWPRGSLTKQTELTKVRVFYQTFTFEKGTYTPLSDVETEYLMKIPTISNTTWVTTIPTTWKRAYPRLQAQSVSLDTLLKTKDWQSLATYSAHELRPLYLSNAQYEKETSA